MNNKKILLIEDNQDLANLLTVHINDLGYDLDCAYDGIEGLEKFENNTYLLIVFDLMLPKLDGFKV